MYKPFRVRSVGFVVCVVLGLAPWVSSCIDLGVNSGDSTKCGDGIAGEDEFCDDGNEVDGDGCDSNCTQTYCGNGVVSQGEQCDDSNAIDGDGCDSNCTFTGCGNGVLTDGEQCDDGNTTNGDGCDETCQPPMPVCGDKNAEPPEECDDGNASQGDGCGLTCKVEHPEVCPGTPIQLVKGQSLVISGSTTGATDKFVGAPSGIGNCGTGMWNGPDVVYAVTPSVTGSLIITLDPVYTDPILHVRTQCPGTTTDEIACRYGMTANVSETVAVQAGGTYYVAVDSWNNQSGTFTLTLLLQ